MTATYRLQVQGVGLRRVAGLVPYLQALGVDTLYLSPVFAARPGSSHGYDVVDHGAVDPALGGRGALDDLLQVVGRHAMTVLLDIVPNHMATHAANPYWWDVLRLGASSQWSSMFDVDWEAQGGRLLVPVLGSPFGDVLQSGDLRVVSDPAPGEGRTGGVPGEAVLRYHDRSFPLAPGTLDKVLGAAEELGQAGPLLGGRRGRPRSFDRLEQLLDLQHYRLAYWRLARTEGNYRRFFDIDDLIGVRQEDEHVYEETHAVCSSTRPGRRRWPGWPTTPAPTPETPAPSSARDGASSCGLSSPGSAGASSPRCSRRPWAPATGAT